MEWVTLKNFRCFHEEQTVRLAPLTLLVGENSTGKTSFLALLKALYDASYSLRTPDFKEAPYDLGSFDEIAHHRGTRADSFEAGYYARDDRNNSGESYRYEITFEERGTAPVPVRRQRALGGTWIDERHRVGQPFSFKFGTPRGVWEGELPAHHAARMDSESDRMWPPAWVARLTTTELNADEGDLRLVPLDGSPEIISDDQEKLNALSNFGLVHFLSSFGESRTFASAPVRSKPQRTYDPARPTRGPEGDYVPMYLANLVAQDKEKWEFLKKQLEVFGRAAGLFDEISIKRLGKRAGEPFQVQVRKFGRRLKGPPRNLIDVGYGVSQVLPVVTELLREDAKLMFLLQQPEVHLHPNAQAALGSLFCQIASPSRQLVIETHSDHLMDRVRMDVRDGVTDLQPSDVSILFFERQDLDVRIYSLRIDEEGNISDAPDGYRSFFMEEITRSMWKNHGQGKD